MPSNRAPAVCEEHPACSEVSGALKAATGENTGLARAGYVSRSATYQLLLLLASHLLILSLGFLFQDRAINNLPPRAVSHVKAVCKLLRNYYFLAWKAIPHPRSAQETDDRFCQ